MMTKRITIIEVKDYVGQEVTIGAWVANKSGKGKIAFLQLRERNHKWRLSIKKSVPCSFGVIG